jgi:hypothetical protein
LKTLFPQEKLTIYSNGPLTGDILSIGLLTGWSNFKTKGKMTRKTKRKRKKEKNFNDFLTQKN